MIRNVCIHVANEQPLLADLYALPVASDAGLVCTNVRGLDGKRPVFIDHTTSTFFFPYHVVRFLEIPAGAARAVGLGRSETPGTAASSDDADVDAGDPADRLPVVVDIAADAADGAEELDTELEIDEDFLQRIRDI